MVSELRPQRKDLGSSPKNRSNFIQNMDKDKIIEAYVSDAMTGKPIQFEVEDKKFTINPPVLGKIEILSKYYLMLEIDEAALKEEPHLESMRICESKTDVVCTLMAVATFENKEDLLSDEKIKERAEFFKWNTYPKDFASVVLALLTQTDYEGFISSIRLTKMLRLNKPNH